MSEEALDALLARMGKIAEATNAFGSEAVQLAAFDALMSAFDNRASDKLRRPPSPSSNAETNGDTKPKAKRRASTRKKGDSEGGGPGISADAPKLDRDLDTSKLGAFYGQYEPKNHPEKILVFLSFLTEELGIESPNTDQVYTCYVKANERVPKAFAQAFRDTSGRSFGYIDYKSPTDIRITTSGTNHFKFDLKTKTAE